MAQSSSALHVKEKIDLMDKEKKIFSLLIDVIRHFSLKTQLRVAGGWVRDKPKRGSEPSWVVIESRRIVALSFFLLVGAHRWIHMSDQLASFHLLQVILSADGARFEFVLDEELKKAASDAEVKAALADKISRERIGHELFWVIFGLPDDSEPPVVDGSDRFPLLTISFKILSSSKIKMLKCASERFVCLIHLIASSDDSELVSTDLEEENIKVPLSSRKRILAGLLLRQIKDFWCAALLMSTLLYTNVDDAKRFLAWHFELDQRREWFKRVENSIMELDLDNVWKVKPLLDGNAIMKVLQVKKAGPEVGELVGHSVLRLEPWF